MAITITRTLRDLRIKPLARVWTRRTPHALIAMTLPLFLQPVQAAEWDFRPSVEVRESYSDNVRLQPVGQERGDFVTEVIPRFSLTGTGRRLKLSADYAVDGLFYKRDSSQNNVLHDLRGTVTAEIIDDLFYFDGKTSVSQQNIGAFGPQTLDNINTSAGRAEVRSISLTPILRHRFSDVARAEMRYSLDRFETDNAELENTRTDRLSFVLGSGPAFQNIEWGLLYSDEKTHYARSGTVDITTYFGSLRYNVLPTFALTATGGHETYGYVTTKNRSQGVLWTVGFSWRPSTRTNVDASVGHRFFGTTASLAASHRARHSVWVVGYNEDITTTQSQFQVDSSLNTANFLNRLWTTSIPDAVTRRGAVEAFIRDTGLPASISTAVNSFSNQFFLQKTLQASVALNGARNTAMVTVYDSRRRAQGGLNIDFLLFGANATLQVEENARQVGINGFWSYRLGEHTRANLSAGMSKITSSTSTREDRSKNIRLALTHQLSNKVRASIEVRRLQQDSSVANSNVRENAIAASVTADF